MKERKSEVLKMRFNVVERDPEMMFSGVRNNLENLLNAVMIGDASDLENRMYQPLSEVRENDTEYKVSVQLPGIKKEDINIELDKNTLTISAESKFEDVKDNENLHYSQFSYGKFHKTIELAKPIDVEHSNCEYNDGILQITLKKQEGKKETHTLKIK